MKIVLSALNTRYIHSNLAIRYLSGVVSEAHEVILAEFTIHDPTLRIADEIRKQAPDLIGFSMYMWNVRQTCEVIRTIKQMIPECVIVTGGPEVSFETDTFLTNEPAVDYAICGEGEGPFAQLIHNLAIGDRLTPIPGVLSKKSGIALQNPNVYIDMDKLPFPYAKSNMVKPHQIVYYESSRGCPFSCAFCMSSMDRTVRSKSLERVKSELAMFLEMDIQQVKFVDRTFNYDVGRAVEIWTYLRNHYRSGINFHFEISADLLDEASIRFLNTIPKGYFQFEIGIQSTNTQTLMEVCRHGSWDSISRNVEAIRLSNNIHLHLDLIVGLPYEDMSSFHRSFNQIYQLNPHMLQVGFLKLLKGTLLHASAGQYQYRYMPDPPYQVLSNRWMDVTQISALTDFEEMVEIYFNSERFIFSIPIAVQESGGDPFVFFYDFSRYWTNMRYNVREISMKEQYKIFIDYGEASTWVQMDWFMDAIKMDYLLREKSNSQPDWLPTDPLPLHTALQLLDNPCFRRKYLLHLDGKTTRQIMRNVHFEWFSHNLKTGMGEKACYMIDYHKDSDGNSTFHKIHLNEFSPDQLVSEKE